MVWKAVGLFFFAISACGYGMIAIGASRDPLKMPFRELVVLHLGGLALFFVPLYLGAFFVGILSK